MRRLAFVLGVVALAVAGCGPPTPTGCPDTGADFTCDSSGPTVKTGEVWTGVISPDCVSTCHKPGGTAVSYGDYSSAAAFQTTNVGQKSVYAGSKGTLKKVDPDALQNSSVWLKVIGGAPAGRKGPQCEGVGNAMPDGAATLSDAKKKLLKDWICSGAAQ